MLSALSEGVPPVFDGCTAVVSPAQQAACRDAYWRAVTQLGAAERADEARAALEAALESCQRAAFDGAGLSVVPAGLGTRRTAQREVWHSSAAADKPRFSALSAPWLQLRLVDRVWALKPPGFHRFTPSWP